jgi:hypothetical protein
VGTPDAKIASRCREAIDRMAEAMIAAGRVTRLEADHSWLLGS